MCTALCIALVSACSSSGGSTGNPGAAVNSGSEQSTASPAMQKLISAAKAEGQLFAYSGVGEDSFAAVANAFTKMYGIKVTSVRGPTGTLVQRFSADKSAGINKADIFMTSAPSFYESDHPTWFTTLNPDVVPNLANWPKDDSSPHHISWSSTIFGIQYNTNMIKDSDVPSTWAQLAADSALKGKVLISDPRSSANYAGWADLVASKDGMNVLDSIGNLDPQIVSTGSDGAQRVAAGSAAANFPAYPEFSTELSAKGAPIKFKPITGPLGANEMDIGLVAGSPHPAAAALFMNFLLTADAAKVYCAIETTALPQDPDGKLGCEATGSDPDHINYTLSKSRQNALFNALHLS
jgi:iron(III) transport system substrate-binding protein